ncbi:hypothetical protein [Bacillus sp. RIT 809]|uniref:hypothetical protein n=1 Tax=Bacillus sp. RIT 809 TaxID=2803857 RepID=UPI001952238F|nr:hypothetical protein [Bacillus sp. RIT 809]MBM6648975.1 hypothetical protein [Bacillus sp. RIT 809]
MANNKLTIKVDADTTEALKQMKEVTEAANECVAALEKLEKVMGKFRGDSEPIVMNSSKVLEQKNSSITSGSYFNYAIR